MSDLTGTEIVISSIQGREEPARVVVDPEKGKKVIEKGFMVDPDTGRVRGVADSTPPEQIIIDSEAAGQMRSAQVRQRNWEEQREKGQKLRKQREIVEQEKAGKIGELRGGRAAELLVDGVMTEATLRIAGSPTRQRELAEQAMRVAGGLAWREVTEPFPQVTEEDKKILTEVGLAVALTRGRDVVHLDDEGRFTKGMRGKYLGGVRKGVEKKVRENPEPYLDKSNNLIPDSIRLMAQKALDEAVKT